MTGLIADIKQEIDKKNIAPFFELKLLESYYGVS